MALNQLKFDQLETGSVYPITASYALNSSNSGTGSGGTPLVTGSTYPITSSWSNYSISSSYSVSSSYSSNSTSASYSSTASVALNALTASYLDPISQSLIPSTGSVYSLGSPTNKWKDLYVSTGSIYIGDTVLSTSGSILLANESPIVTLNTASGQIEISGLTASLSASYSSTASVALNALNALTSSYSLNSISSSYSNFATTALSASYAPGGGGGTSLTTGSSYPITSSWSVNALTASYALNAPNVESASFATVANSSTSASYALTASFALNSVAGATGSEGGGLFTVTSDGFNYNIAGYSGTFPTITVARGQLYYFNVSGVSASHPFALRLSSGNTATVPGTTNNDPVNGLANTNTLISYRVPNDAPNSIVYQCVIHSGMIGTINIVNQYGTTLTTGSTYPITSSWATNAISSSFATSANTAVSANSATSANTATSASFATVAGTATSATTTTSASYALTASFALNASGGSGTVSGSANYISKFTSGTAVGNSVIYETGSNIGIGTINPNAKLNINSSGSLVSGSVVFSVEGTQGSLFSVDDSLSGSLMSVNDISGLPILEVFSDDRLVVGTYNANTLVVTGSRVGIGTSVPVAKLQVSGNISASSFTSSVSSGVGFLGTSSFASTASFSLTASNVVTASYALNALTASFALNASGGGGGGSGTVTGSVNYISKFTTTTTVGNSVIYETGSNIGIGTTIPNSKLNINSSGSLASGSVVFSVEGTQGSLFSVDDSLSGSLMSVNDISGLPILEVFSDDRLVVGTYNSNALVVTGSRVGIGINNPVAKLQVNGNISGSSFTGSVFGTSSWATNALSASYAPGGGTTLTTGSTYPITSSWAATSSNIIGGTSNYIPLWSTNTSLGNSVLYQSSSNVGIGTTSPGYKLDVVGAVKSTIDSNFSFVSNRSGTTVWCGLGFLTNNVNKWFVGLRETSDDNLRWYNFTNSTERMVLTETGNLGIGTSTPASILHLQSSAVTTLLRIDNTNISNDAAILLTDNNNPTGEGFRITYDSSVGDTYFNNIFTSSIQAFNFQKGNFGSGTSLLTILNSGNVGIGTTSPAYKLDVNGSASFADNVIITKNQNALTRLIVSNTTSNSNSYVETAFVNDVASGTGAVGRYGSTTTTYKIVTSNNQYLYNGPTAGDIAILNDFASGSIKMSAGGNSNVQFIISSSGNVGIGTTSPVAKLQVNGNISGSSFTGSVFGTSSWANNATSASFASTASYNLNSISSSYALTASFALNSAGGGGGGGSISYITGSPVVGQYIVVSGSSTTQYTLTQSVSNPEHLLVSVNGVVQNYSSSYTVTGSTINFYQPYSDGDEIDVRFLNGGTTVQTGSIAGQTILYNFSSSQESTLTGLNLTGNKWGVNVIEEWNSGSGDIYFNSCSLLLHFDSINSSGSFIDNSLNNFAITSSGGAGLSTSQYKFGGASAYFDGSGDYLTTPLSSNLQFGTGDFTIECWNYMIARINSDPAIFSNYNSYTIGALSLFAGHGAASTTSYQVAINGAAFPTIQGGTIAYNTWVHLAVVRNSGTIKLYVNGTSVGTPYSTAVTLNGVGSLFYIGSTGDSLATGYINGYIDEVRITKGVARYTSNFTPQSFAFPNSAAQIATKYIGLVGGLNDTNVDYGIEKLTDTSLKIKKLTDTQQPSGSFLSSSVDRVYVNVLNYDNVSISGSISNAVTASYALNSVTSVTSSFALSASYLIPTTTTGTTKAIFGYGNTSVAVSITNLVSNTGVVATDTTGVGSARYALAAAGYSTDKAIFGYGYTSAFVSITNLVSNTGVVATDTTGVGTTRIQLAAARYGSDKAIFGYGSDPSSIGLSMTNLVNNVGLVASDTTGVGTGRRLLAAAEYATDRAIFGYGYASGTNLSMTNLVGNNGIVASDTTGVGTARYGLAATGYGGDKAIFGYGNTGAVVSTTNLVSNTGVVATNTTGVGTARVDLAAAGYGNDKAIFGYGYNGSANVSMTNLVSNTGVVATDTTGVGTARHALAAAGYSTS